MVFTRVFVLCLCGASLFGIEGARTETKAVEVALEDIKKKVEPQTIKEEDEANDEQEDSIEGGEELQPGGCKRWCTKVAIGFPADMAWIKKQTDAKCDKEICKDCAGGGLTIPDCREKEVVVEPEDEEPTGEDDVPQCTVNPAGPVNVCKLKEDVAELTCTHVSTPWCMPPSRNPGHKYRAGSQPLCCDTEDDVSESDMTEVTKKVDEIKEVFENEKEKEDDPPAPVPLCVPGHTFEVDSFMRRGKKVHVCRDQVTGKFAKNVCCDPLAFKLLADQEKANEVCATVKKKWCKPHINVFEGKRNKYKEMPDTFSCKRMYMCCERGGECYGPVPSHVWCLKKNTGLDKNRPASPKCVAAKL